MRHRVRGFRLSAFFLRLVLICLDSRLLPGFPVSVESLHSAMKLRKKEIATLTSKTEVSCASFSFLLGFSRTRGLGCNQGVGVLYVSLFFFLYADLCFFKRALIPRVWVFFLGIFFLVYPLSFSAEMESLSEGFCFYIFFCWLVCRFGRRCERRAQEFLFFFPVLAFMFFVKEGRRTKRVLFWDFRFLLMVCWSSHRQTERGPTGRVLRSVGFPDSCFAGVFFLLRVSVAWSLCVLNY